MSRILLVTLGLVFSVSAFANSNWVGALAPDFKLEDQNGDTKTLKDYKGDWLVLYFYPKDDTPGCTTEAKNFRDKYSDYQAIGAEIVGVSLDDVSSHKEFSNAYKLPFDILADVDQEVSKSYKVLAGFGPMEYAERETFIIDSKGNIVHHYADVDPDTHSDEVLEKLKELIKAGI